jgi:phosphoribosylaminoimidazole carboxylase PurE protein
VAKIAAEAQSGLYSIIIAGAGGAAHLAGAFKALAPTVPVLGVPLASSELKGIDALYSTLQMPPGIPVATFAVGAWGAENAALFAAEILALHDDSLRRRLLQHRIDLANAVPERPE